MATTPSKVHFPTNQDDWDPAGDMQGIAQSIRHIVPVANATERNAVADAYQPSPMRPLYVDRTDIGTLERNNGSGWQTVANPGAQPFAMAAGGVTVPGGSGSMTSASVSFPSGRFSVTPHITLTVHSISSTQISWHGVFNRSATGFDAYVVRSTSANTVFMWTATQMTPTSATG